MRLAEAVDRFYEAFRVHSLRSAINACPCCVNDAQQARLREAPLRELSSDALGYYAWKAMTTWGDDRDFRHFLPRLLEHVAAGRLDSAETIFGKLLVADWTAWPNAETQAIKDFVAAWGHDLLVNYQSHVDVVGYLFAANLVLDDLRPLLAAWDASTNPAALQRLADLCYAIAGDQFRTNHWEDTQTHSAVLEEWLFESRRADMLEAAAYDDAYADIAEELDLAAFFLRRAINERSVAKQAS